MELQVFSNAEFGSVRSIMINDEPYFVGKDVAEILGYSRTADAIKVHVDKEDKGVCEMQTPGGVQNVTIINESGLYSLILSSKMPNAKKFKRWVTSEVLPAIRKHGVFAVDTMLNDPDAMIAALQVYLPGVTNRFVTVTGDMYRSGNVERNDEGLATTLDTFMKRKTATATSTVEPCSYLTDEQVMQHALNSESGEKFKALYNGQWEELYDSQSDADMALVAMLAFWCGNVEEQIDRIFRESGLMREKWDRNTGDSTYGQITIRNAVSSNSTIYTPIRDAATSAEDEFKDLDDPEDSEDMVLVNMLISAGICQDEWRDKMIENMTSKE